MRGLWGGEGVEDCLEREALLYGCLSDTLASDWRNSWGLRI